ncbi:MAG: hypothetical protein SGCHY_004007 [Lobulomycetales sp.]
MRSLLLLAAAACIQLASSQSLEECVATPSNATCAGFQYSEELANADLDSLCRQMPFMVGCSLRKQCQDAGVTAGTCSSFSLLGSVCAADHPRMGGCRNYRSLCLITGSGDQATGPVPTPAIVEQCAVEAPVPNLISSLQASNQIKSICNEMNMDGCDRCTDTGTTYMNCDLLDTYAFLCKAMPDMNQCGEWKSMCASGSATGPDSAISSACSLSASSPNNPPTMKMFFHTGINEFVLFRDWIPRTELQYLGTMAVLLILSIFYEFLIAYQTILEATWNLNPGAVVFPFSVPGQQYSGMGGKGYTIIMIRFVLKFVSATLGYALMLVTMTFNVGLYFSVVLGLAIGYAFCVGWAKKAVIAKGASVDDVPVSDSCC